MNPTDLTRTAAATIRFALDGCTDPSIEPSDRLVRLLCYAQRLQAGACVPTLHRQIAEATLNEAREVLAGLFVPPQPINLASAGPHFAQLAAFAGGTKRLFANESGEVLTLVGRWQQDAEALAHAACAGPVALADAFRSSFHLDSSDARQFTAELSQAQPNRYVAALLGSGHLAPVTVEEEGELARTAL